MEVTMKKAVTQTIIQDDAPENINWRGDVTPAIPTKRDAVNAMNTLAGIHDNNFFRIQKRGTRWFVQVGQV
tara:strand:- start:581 stop:793 length:213 start_codon:yes stop_codon:yes gene_type:complete